MATSQPLLGNPLLDYLRAYDLNDYSLGLAVTTSESPYSGASNSDIAYPYLTSFNDSSLTSDWFLISEGNLGLRWAPPESWEIGIVGRVNMLGLGTDDIPELEGLNDRNWTLEVAPMIGWRGWPVHVNFRTYFEILDRHSGTTSELIFRLPRRYNRGFLIPSVRAVYQSSGYNAYYYGVSTDESRPDRPAYQPGSSISTAARVRWGYQLTEKWLLSGSVVVELLGDEITASPIVDKKNLWTANIGLAYNDDVFQHRIAELGSKKQPKLEIRMAAFDDSVDSKISRNADDGSPGTEVDLENLLGLSNNETVFQVEAFYRFNDFHRLEISYHELGREGSVTLEQDVRFGDTVFAAGTDVVTRVGAETLRVGYAYSLMNDAQKELGVMAGLHFSNTKTSMVAPLTGQSETSDFSTPLPVIGVHGSVELGANSTLGARVQIFALEFDRVDGSVIRANLEWQRRFGNNFSAGVAYNFYKMNLDSSENDVQGTLKILHQGPALFVSANF